MPLSNFQALCKLVADVIIKLPLLFFKWNMTWHFIWITWNVKSYFFSKKQIKTSKYHVLPLWLAVLGLFLFGAALSEKCVFEENADGEGPFQPAYPRSLLRVHCPFTINNWALTYISKVNIGSKYIAQMDMIIWALAVCIWHTVEWMAGTSLGPRKFVRDMGRWSHWGFIMAPGQEANGDNLGQSLRSSIQ